MEKVLCEYCNKKFSNRSNLTNHLKRAKYCIKNRPEFKQVDTDINHKCHSCVKTFTTKYMLQSHQLKCQTKKNEEFILLEKKYVNCNIELEQKNKIITLKDQEIMFLKQQLIEKNQEIESFKQQIGSIALEGVKKSTTTNTITTSNTITNILSPLDLNDQKIQDIIENCLNESHFLEAQKGVAKFCFENLIKTEDGKRRMVCSDPVRERYRYIDEKGNIREDIQARQFIEKISKPVIETCKKLHEDLKDKYSQIKKDIKRGIEKGISDYIVDIKEKHAEQCLIDIHDIPFETRNKKFRKELAIRSNV